MQTIYEVYVPTEQSKKDKIESIFTQAVEIFKEECESLNADSADDVEIPLSRGLNTKLFWETVLKTLPKFENQTKLTIFESTLMTKKRELKIIKDRKDAEPPVKKEDK